MTIISCQSMEVGGHDVGRADPAAELLSEKVHIAEPKIKSGAASRTKLATLIAGMCAVRTVSMMSTRSAAAE